MADVTPLWNLMTSCATPVNGAIAWCPPVMKLVGNISMLGGIALFVYSILKLQEVEQGKATLKAVFFKVLTAVGLVAMKPTMAAFEGSMGISSGASNNILAGTVADVSGSGVQCAMAKGILTFVKLIGLIAIARGLMLLKLHGENKDGSLGRALTHIVGGAMSINIEWTARALASAINSKAALAVLCL